MIISLESCIRVLLRDYKDGDNDFYQCDFKTIKIAFNKCTQDINDMKKQNGCVPTNFLYVFIDNIISDTHDDKKIVQNKIDHLNRKIITLDKRITVEQQLLYAQMKDNSSKSSDPKSSRIIHSKSKTSKLSSSRTMHPKSKTSNNKKN